MAETSDATPSARLRTRRRVQPVGVDAAEPLLAKPRGTPKRGGMLMAAAGCAFFAYAFNVGGLQGWIDGLLHGLDSNLKSHNSMVAAAATRWMPYIGAAFGTLVLLYMASVVVSLLGGGKKAKKAAKQKRAAVAGQEPVRVAEGAVLIKPMRISQP